MRPIMDAPAELNQYEQFAIEYAEPAQPIIAKQLGAIHLDIY